MIPAPSEVLERARALPREWRAGQCLFNALRLLAPTLASQLTGTDADCFYNDNKIPAFWAALAKARNDA